MEPVVSLFWIALVSVVSPLLAGLVPRKLLPEVVLLLVGGVLIGPHVLHLAVNDSAVNTLRELGLGMLFLLAGFEIEMDELTGRGGRRALATWLSCLAIAFVTVWVIGLTGAIHAETAVAIALVSTALGTLLPILKDAGQLGTPLGRTILNHGAVGELGPIVAMALLLGSHGAFASFVALVAFAALAFLVGLHSTRFDTASRIVGLIRAGAETTGQTTVRLTVLLLVTLGALAVAFDLDGILGAFAAGFVLRRALPEGDESLEHKLNGLAFGLLIPVFFVTSGMAIDPAALAEEPGVLVIFVLMIVLVRGVPVWLSTLWQRDPTTGERQFGDRDSLRVGILAATGLPIIVAVTSVAVTSGQMTTANASVLVAGGAITVLLLPMTSTLLGREEPEEPEGSTALEAPAD